MRGLLPVASVLQRRDASWLCTWSEAVRREKTTPSGLPGGGATNARGRRGGQPFKEPIQDIGDEAGEDTVEYQVNDRICHGGCEQCGGVGFFFLLRFSAPCFALEE